MSEPRIILPAAQAAVPDAKLELLKSHIAGYTRKDGTFVKDHDTKVTSKVLPDDHDFHAQLGGLKDGEKAHFGNSVFKKERFHIENKGGRYHFGGPVAPMMKLPGGPGYTLDEVATRLKKWHTGDGVGVGKNERLTHESGNDGGEPLGAESAKIKARLEEERNNRKPRVSISEATEKTRKLYAGGSVPPAISKLTERLLPIPESREDEVTHGDGESHFKMRHNGSRQLNTMDEMGDQGWKLDESDPNQDTMTHPDGHVAKFGEDGLRIKHGAKK